VTVRVDRFQVQSTSQQAHPSSSELGHFIDMAFKAFVEVGRAVLVVKGPEAGKLGVIGTSSPKNF